MKAPRRSLAVTKIRETNLELSDPLNKVAVRVNQLVVSGKITNNKNELFKWYFDFGVYSYELNILNDSLDYYKKALANVNDEYIFYDSNKYRIKF